MKFDTIIIGGGLAGLVCGLELQNKGKKCAIISAGQNAMHFSSGTFSLLSYDKNGKYIENPVDAMKDLDENHPYSKIGIERVNEYVDNIKSKFQNWGLHLHGNPRKNGFMFTHLGNIRPAWLSFDDTTMLESQDEMVGKKALIINFDGYLDFNTSFIAQALDKKGAISKVASIRMEELERLRKSPTEMRSVNIARVMDNENVWKKLIESIKGLLKDEDLVVLPAVFGFSDTKTLEAIKERIPVKTMFIGTMPPSVPGIRSQMILKNSFKQAGGVLVSGDTVTEAKIKNKKVLAIKTENLDNYELEADNFVLATGSFFSRGLWATPKEIIEPLMHLDVDYLEGRSNWYDEDFFKSHNYLSFGVRTNKDFKPSINGETIDNLYVIGSILSGFNPIDSGCGAGVSILSALEVANKINNN